MATGYWRGAQSALWSATSSWYTTAAGTTAVASVPGSADTAYFSANNTTDFRMVFMNGNRTVNTLISKSGGFELYGGTSTSVVTQTLTVTSRIWAQSTATSATNLTQSQSVNLSSTGNLQITNDANDQLILGPYTNASASPVTLTFNGTGTGNPITMASIGNGTSVTNLTVNGSNPWWQVWLTAASTYTGKLTITAGPVAVGTTSSAALGASTSSLALNGGALVVTHNSAVNFDSAGASTIGGNFQIGRDGNSGWTGDITLNNPFDLGGASRTLTVYNTAKLTGVLSNGALTKAGTGKLVLSGASTIASGVTVNAGTLALSGYSTPLSGTVTSGPVGTGTLVLAGGTLTSEGDAGIGNALSAPADLTLSSTNGSLALNGDLALTANRTVTVTEGGVFLGGIISGTGFGITKMGVGTLGLSGNMTATGAVNVNEGVLYVSSASGLGSGVTRTVTVANGATLSVGAAMSGTGLTTSVVGYGLYGMGALNPSLSGSYGLGALSLAGPTMFRAYSGSSTLTSGIATNGHNLELSASSASTTYSGSIQGRGSILVSGYSGTVRLAGSNDIGNVLVGGATTLQAYNSFALGNSSASDPVRTVQVFPGATLEVGATTTTLYATTLDVTLEGGGASATFPGAALAVTNGASATFKSITLTGQTGIALSNGALLAPVETAGYPLMLQAGFGSPGGNMWGLITGSGDLVYQSAPATTGTLRLRNAANTYTGKTIIQYGTLEAEDIENAGVPSSLGAPTGSNAPIVLGSFISGISVVAELSYVGTGATSTDRDIELTAHNPASIRAAYGVLTLNGAFTGASVTAPKTLNFSTGSSAAGINVNSPIGDFGGYPTSVSASGSGATTLGANNSTYTGTTAVNGSLYATSLKNVGGGASSLGAPTTVAGGTIAIGASSSLRYLGGVTSTDRNITFGGTSTAANGYLEHWGVGTLTLTGGITSASAVSERWGEISGSRLTNVGTPLTSAYGNIVISGPISDAAANFPFSFIKSGNNVATLTGANVFTGLLSVTGGILEIPSAAALGGSAPSRRVISATQMRFPNAITIPSNISLLNGAGSLRPGRTTYALYEFNAPSTVAGGVNTAASGTTGALTIQANDDVTFTGPAVVGSIAVAAGKTVTFAPSGTTTTTTLMTAFVSGSSVIDVPVAVNVPAGARVASGGVSATAHVTSVVRYPAAGYQRVILSTTTTGVGTVGQAVSFIAESMSGTTVFAGPGTFVLKGTTRSYNPYLKGATLRHIIDGVNTYGNGSFFSSNSTYSNWGSTDSALEFSNEGAVTAGSKSWGNAGFNSGTVTVRNLRVAPYDLKIALPINPSGTQQWSTLYVDNANAGTLSASNGLDFNTATLGQRINSAAFISDGSSLVPAYRHADGYVTYPVYGTTALFDTQAGGSSITSTGSTQNVNLSAPITAQGTAQMSSVRLAAGGTGAVTLQSGAKLNVGLVMDMVTGASRTVVSGGTLSGLTSYLSLYSANTAGSVIASPILLGLGPASTSALVKAGPGKVVHTAPVRTNNVMTLNEGSWEFQAGFDSGVSYSMNLASPASGNVELRLKSRSRTAGLNGGNERSTVVLDGADLEIWSGSGGYYGDITGTGKYVKTGHSYAGSGLHGTIDGVGLELVTGQVEVNTAYGATTLNNPPVTFRGPAVLAASQNQTVYSGELAFGALTLAPGASGSVTHFGVPGNAGGPQVTSFTSLARSGTNYLQLPQSSVSYTTSYIKVGGGSFGYVPAASAGSATAVVRLQAGQVLSGGGVAPVDGILDRMLYGTGRDAALDAVLVSAGATMGSVGGGHVYLNGSVTAQPSISLKSISLGSSTLAMAAGQTLSVDQLIGSNTGSTVTGVMQTANTDGDGALYHAAAGTYPTTIQDGAVPTKLVRASQTTTLSGTSTYTGGTWFLGGTTTAATEAALGAVPSTPTDNLYFSGGSLVLSTGGISNNRGIVAVGGGGALTFTSAGATYAGKISGPGLLTISGGAYATPVVISGNNADYSGSILLSGTIRIEHDNALGTGPIMPTGNVFILGTGVTSAFDPSGRFDRNASALTLENASGNTITFRNTVQPGFQAPFLKRGTSPIVIDEEQGFSSVTLGYSQPLTATQAAGGILRVTKSNGLGYGNVTVVAGDAPGTAFGAALEISGDITLPNTIAASGYGYGGDTGVVRNVSGANVVTGGLTLSSGAGPATIGVDSGSLTIQGAVGASGVSRFIKMVGAGDLVLAGGMTGASSPGLKVTGAGRMFVQGANASSGAIDVSSGTFVASHASALGVGATTTVSGSGKLAVTTDAAANRVNFSGTSELVLG